MKSPDEKLNPQGFFQRSRNHLLQESVMKNILLVLSSPRGWKSHSHQFASHIVDDLKARHPGAKVVVRDVAKEPLPHVGEAFGTGRVLPLEKRSPAEAKALALSDALVDELAAADVVVLARGGVYSEGPAQQLDFQESYLRAVLGFIGITNVHVVRVEGVAMGEEALKNAMASAKAQSEEVVREFA